MSGLFPLAEVVPFDLADSRLDAPLLGLQSWWDIDQGLLARAIDACSPPTGTSAE